VSGRWLRGAASPIDLRALEVAVDRGTLSLRGADRALRVAWTLADLAGRSVPGSEEVGRAIALRTRGQVAG
jgi:magnesium chelatase family protein